MKKTLLLLLGAVIIASLVFQAGKWSGRQLAQTQDISHTSPAQNNPAVQTFSTEPDKLSDVVDRENITKATSSNTLSIMPDEHTALPAYDVTQLIQFADNRPQLHLSDAVLSLAPEQLQELMWQLEQQSMQTSTYHRQQQLQQQFNHAELGNLVQLNCSETLCIAMLQYAEPHQRKAAMPLLSELTNTENLQATFLSKADQQYYYSFMMIYGWQ